MCVCVCGVVCARAWYTYNVPTTRTHTHTHGRTHMDAHTQVVIKCTLSALQKIQYRQLSYATLRCRDEQVRVCMCVHVLRCGCMCVLTHVVRCVLHANAPPLVIGILAHNTSSCLCVCKAHNTIHTCHAHTRHACRPCPSALMPTRVRGRERWWVGGVLSRQRFLHHAILAELLLATQRTVCGTRCCFSHDTLRGRTRGRGTSKRPRTTTRSCGFAKCATILTSWMGPVSLTVHSPCACALSFTLLLFLSLYFPRTLAPLTSLGHFGQACNHFGAWCWSLSAVPIPQTLVPNPCTILA